jgi:hypothetical protein
VGDVVLVNVQASELALGSGGFDVLYANLTRGLRLPPEQGAHVMSLPYAPGQLANRFAEEDDDARLERIDVPVVCLGLHSQLAPACAALRGRRVAYLQLAGGALPVSLSDAVRALRARRLLETTIAVAPCLDADVQCVSVAGGLTQAVSGGAEVVICGIGPGIVGTGSPWGHGGLAVAEAANVAHALGGRPVVAPRVSFSDARERHRGLSHHTRSALALCLGEVRVAWPLGLEAPDDVPVTEVDVEGWELAVLRGARETIRRRGRALAIFVEMHPSAWPLLGTSRESLLDELRAQRLQPVSLGGSGDLWAIEGMAVELRHC